MEWPTQPPLYARCPLGASSNPLLAAQFAKSAMWFSNQRLFARLDFAPINPILTKIEFASYVQQAAHYARQSPNALSAVPPMSSNTDNRFVR